MHKIRGVPSTYHHVLRCPFEKGVMDIRGDQKASKGCTISNLQAAKELNK